MEIKLTLQGHTRKEAADCIGSAIGVAPVYRAAPSFSYDIGGVILDRQGVLTISSASFANNAPSSRTSRRKSAA